MEKFRAGNIIKDPYGNIEIFVRYHTNQVSKKSMFDWVCFNHSGASGSTPVEDEETTKNCDCIEEYYTGEEYADYNPDCPRCKGTGQYQHTRLGERHYKLLADNAKDYLEKLLRGALKNL